MTALQAGDWDGESVVCPECGQNWADLWDYEWRNREEIRIECPHCDAPLILQRSISVDYRALRDAAARGEGRGR